MRDRFFVVTPPIGRDRDCLTSLKFSLKRTRKTKCVCTLPKSIDLTIKMCYCYISI